MKVQVDTIALRRELNEVLRDDHKAAEWLRDFELTLGCWGTNPNPQRFALDLIIEADTYKANLSLVKMRNAVIKELGPDADETDIENRMAEKYGSRYRDAYEMRQRGERLKNKAPVDAATRKDADECSLVSNGETLKSRPSTDAKLSKNSYGEFQNVKMTTAEFEKLVQAEGAERANALIEELSSYLASSGKRYKSHYATLLNWGRRKDKESEPKQKFLTTEEISRRNYEESKKQLAQILEARRHG